MRQVLGTHYYQIKGFRNLGIGGLKHKTNKLNKIEFLQFLNP